ncbi:Gfo/Idh/MocA family protein [Nakamurella leprariae]|uniref:Gfo/Idh/MocA family oxidoreductase n=1 Tax=Nakamurella leprariae TaxID=2803911 RepID=A0A938YCU2_9ACTN|nr:Gfo/Idh/MocA family oxidoreductase [Nakamurella leprariae]MBM9468302.1 Gfo/Idh/MocA family oxidoreductase [Nakamurella leprariae]
MTGPGSPLPPVRVGLVGAGPWAQQFWAPTLATGPRTRLTAVWARRSEAATALADRYQAKACASLDELFGRCEAVAFAVPPDVQPDLAVRAAAAGRHLLLDKPLGLTLEQADRVADAVRVAGVISVLNLTNRFSPLVRDFLARVAPAGPVAGQAVFISSAAREGGMFATPWRQQHGALPDLAPHVLDLLDAGVGRIEQVRRAPTPQVERKHGGGRTDWVVLDVTHRGGAVSQAILSITAPVEGMTFRTSVLTAGGEVTLTDPVAGDDPAARRALTAEFAAAVRTGRPHPLDAERGRYLARLTEQAVTGT